MGNCLLLFTEALEAEGYASLIRYSDPLSVRANVRRPKTLSIKIS